MKLKRWGVDVSLIKPNGQTSIPKGLHNLDDGDPTYRFFFRKNAEKVVKQSNAIEQLIKDSRWDGWYLLYEVRDRRAE